MRRLRAAVARRATAGDELPLHDERHPLPPGAAERLRRDHPRLAELKRAYAGLDLPVTDASRWSPERVDAFVDLRWFRGETLITWHYREGDRVDELKYWALLRAIRDQAAGDVLDRLGEDGMFGCWTYSYASASPVSRDVLESAAELSFLERTVGLSSADGGGLRVLDIGAGYGRLAHRAVEAFPGRIADWCCVDAVPEATFLSEYYLGYRGVCPPARVVALHELEADLDGARFDVAVNVHSFSECTYAAVSWWMDVVRGLAVPYLLVVPNEPRELLSLEADGSRRDLTPLIAGAGYRLLEREPMIADAATRALVGLDDHLHLFALQS